MPSTQEPTGPAQCCCRLEPLITTSFPEPPASCSRPLDFGETQEAEGAWPGQAYERELQTGTPPVSPPLSRPPSTRRHHAGDASSCTRQERGGPGRGRVTPGPRVHPAADRRAQRPQPGFLHARHPRQKGEVAEVTRKPGGFFLQGPSLLLLPDSEF